MRIENRKKYIAVLMTILCIIMLFPQRISAVEEDSQRETVRVGFFEMNGYHMQDEDGNRSGYGYDTLRLMARYWNVDYEYIGYDKSWSEMQKMLEDGEVDLVTSARKTPEREEKFDYSRPIGSNECMMTIRKNNHAIIAQDYSTYNGIRVGLLNGNAPNKDFEEFSKEKGFTYTPVYFDKVSDMESALQSDSVDALVSSSLRVAKNETAITIGKNLEPNVRKLVDSGTKFVESFNNLSDSQQKAIVKFGAMAAAVPVATLAIGKFLTKFIQVGRKVVEFNSQASLFVQAIGLYRSGATSAALATGTWFSSLSALGAGFVSFLSNPIALGVLAIAGLTAAMVVNHVKSQQLVDTYAQLSEEEQFLKDRTDELKESSDSLAETREQAIQSAKDESAAQENLWKSLQSVTDENGRVMSGKESYAKFVAGELSEALGIEIDIVDGQIKNYEELTKTMQETINKKRALAEQEALGEAYTEALAKQAEATVSYNENLTALAETEGKYNEAVKKRDAILKEMIKTTQETGSVTAEQSEKYQKAKAAVEGYSKKMEKQKKTLEDSKQSMEEYNQTIQNYEGLGAAILEGDADKINEALMKVEQAFKTSDTATTQTLKEQSQNLKENYEKMQKQLKNGAQGITQEMVNQAKSMSDQADAELQKSIDKTKQTLSSKFQELGIEAPQALIDSLAEQDPVAVQTVTDLLNNLNNGVQVTKPQLTEAFSNLGIDVPTSMIKQIAKLEPDAQKQAVQLLMQLQNGEASQRPQVLQQMRDLGIKVDDSVAGGIKDNTDKVKDESGKVGKAGNDELADKMSKQVDSPNVSENTVESARSVGSRAWKAIQSAMSGEIGVRIKETVETVRQNISGKHANGLDYVPYNGYIAELHEGERVLTKQENRLYNSGRGINTGGGDTFNFYNTKPDPYEYARQMKKAKKELMLNM